MASDNSGERRGSFARSQLGVFFAVRNAEKGGKAASKTMFLASLETG
jgi:hypothetical protein